LIEKGGLVAIELYFHRNNIEALEDDRRYKVFASLEAGLVFLGSDDDTGGGLLKESVLKAGEVLGTEEVMVGKGDGQDLRAIAGEEMLKALGIGYCREEDESGPILQGMKRTSGRRKGLAQMAVVLPGEEELLMRLKAERGAHLVFGDLRWTLGDNHDVGPLAATERLAEQSCGQHEVGGDEAVVGGKQNLKAWLNVTVLIGIVKKDYLRRGDRMVVQEVMDGFAATGTDGQDDLGELVLHLTGFVAYVLGIHLRGGKEIAFGLTLVATAHYCRTVMREEEADEVFGVGCLAGASYRKIAYTDDWHSKRLRTKQDLLIEQEVSDPHDSSVEAGGRHQPSV